jgi:hypothetical protein
MPHASEPPPGIDASDATRPRHRSTLFWLLLLIPLGLLGVLAAFVGAGALYLFSATEEEVTAKDRQLVVDVEALAEWIGDYVPDPRNETITKTRYIDRSLEIEYVYDGGADESEPYLQCCVSWEPKLGDARAGYVAMWGGAKLGITYLAETEAEVVERNDLFRWGDQSRFGIITADGAPCGNIFIARKGRFVFLLAIGGVYFDEGQAFGEWVTPALSGLEHYKPLRTK